MAQRWPGPYKRLRDRWEGSQGSQQLLTHFLLRSHRLCWNDNSLPQVRDYAHQIAHGKRRFISGGLIRTSGNFCGRTP